MEPKRRHQWRLGIRKVWCATIDDTPDHLPNLGPIRTSAGVTIKGTTIASAGGHGMMWGPENGGKAEDAAAAMPVLPRMEAPLVPTGGPAPAKRKKKEGC